MMDGEIWVESEPGKGSKFIFTATFGKSKTASQRSLELPIDLRGMRVLLVDDRQSSADILIELLQSLSFEVSHVASGKESLTELEKAVSDHPYELVIMDMQTGYIL